MTISNRILEERITAAAGKHEDAFVGLMKARKIGGASLIKFLDTVPETNEELWKRFENWKKGKPDRANFSHFVVDTIKKK